MTSHDHVLTVFEGGTALSDFRATALLARLQEITPEISAVSARHVHWVRSAGPLEDAGRVAALLTYGDPHAAGPDGPSSLVVVGPPGARPVRLSRASSSPRPRPPVPLSRSSRPRAPLW